MSFIFFDNLSTLSPCDGDKLKAVRPGADVEHICEDVPGLEPPAPHRWLLSTEDLAEKERISVEQISHLSDHDLRVIHQKALTLRLRKAIWFINAEYTDRRIPPAFRHLPLLDTDNLSMAIDLVAIDLYWLARVHAGHKTRVPQWKGFDKPKHFNSKVRFIFAGMDSGKKPIHKAVHGLALTEDQQVECNVFRTEALRARYEQLRRLHVATRGHIEMIYRRNTRHQREDPTLIQLIDIHNVARRADVWLCANLCRWKSPTRVAELQIAWRRATGLPDSLADNRPLSRQLAHKLMGDLKRDLPVGMAVVK